MAQLYTYYCMDIILSSKRKFLNRLFHYSNKQICIKGRHFLNSSKRFLDFDTLYDTVSKQIRTKNL